LCLFFVLSAPEAILASLPRFIRNDVFQAACVGYAYNKSNGAFCPNQWRQPG
jgi:hypothetical protein